MLNSDKGAGCIHYSKSTEPIINFLQLSLPTAYSSCNSRRVQTLLVRFLNQQCILKLFAWVLECSQNVQLRPCRFCVIICTDILFPTTSSCLLNATASHPAPTKPLLILFSSASTSYVPATPHILPLFLYSPSRYWSPSLPTYCLHLHICYLRNQFSSYPLTSATSVLALLGLPSSFADILPATFSSTSRYALLLLMTCCLSFHNHHPYHYFCSCHPTASTSLFDSVLITPSHASL